MFMMPFVPVLLVVSSAVTSVISLPGPASSVFARDDHEDKNPTQGSGNNSTTIQKVMHLNDTATRFPDFEYLAVGNEYVLPFGGQEFLQPRFVEGPYRERTAPGVLVPGMQVRNDSPYPPNVSFRKTDFSVLSFYFLCDDRPCGKSVIPEFRRERSSRRRRARSSHRGTSRTSSSLSITTRSASCRTAFRLWVSDTSS